MVSTNSLKNGMTVKIDGKLWRIDQFQHVNPGKGAAFVRTTLKSLRSGKTVDRTFRAGEELEQAYLQRRTLQYLYREGDDYIFMDTINYEQSTVPSEALGNARRWLLESDVVEVVFHDGEVLEANLPANKELTITDAEPGIQGDRVSGATKPATLETGATIQVPLFVQVGQKVKVDTRSGEYISRVS